MAELAARRADAGIDHPVSAASDAGRPIVAAAAKRGALGRRQVKPSTSPDSLVLTMGLLCMLGGGSAAAPRFNVDDVVSMMKRREVPDASDTESSSSESEASVHPAAAGPTTPGPSKLVVSTGSAGTDNDARDFPRMPIGEMFSPDTVDRHRDQVPSLPPLFNCCVARPVGSIERKGNAKAIAAL